jgi:hypothetical protein
MVSRGNAAILDGYITRQDLAAAINKSVRTIDRWDVHRVGPPRVVVGRTILYRVDSVRAWLESREQRRGRL